VLAQENNSESEVRRIDSVSTSEFSVPHADKLVAEGTAAIATQDYTAAIAKLDEARELYNQLSLFYQELAQMFFGVDTRQNRSNRDLAIEAAQKRDETTYQLALIYRSQGQPEEAIPLLMEVLRSQQPTRDLGEQAYQQLFEMGFVEAPYEFN
jgi:tetratricopeptide (TPR) repeat protein